MVLLAKNGGNNDNFDPIPEGVYIGICYGIVDLGIQYNKTFNNSLHKIRILWEIPDEIIEVNNIEIPRTIGKEYTLSTNEKATLRQHIESWLGRQLDVDEIDEGFDVELLLGKGCQIQIIHEKGDNKIYPKISSIMGLPKYTKLPEVYNDLIMFNICDHELDLNRFLTTLNSLPKYLQDKIKNSEDWVAIYEDNKKEIDNFFKDVNKDKENSNKEIARRRLGGGEQVEESESKTTRRATRRSKGSDKF